MPFSDNDEQSSRRRRGRRRRDDDFDDFWGRESTGGSGRSRRRGGDRDPGDVSDLTGEGLAGPSGPPPATRPSAPPPAPARPSAPAPAPRRDRPARQPAPARPPTAGPTPGPSARPPLDRRPASRPPGRTDVSGPTGVGGAAAGGFAAGGPAGRSARNLGPRPGDPRGAGSRAARSGGFGAPAGPAGARGGTGVPRDLDAPAGPRGPVPGGGDPRTGLGAAPRRGERGPAPVARTGAAAAAGYRAGRGAPLRGGPVHGSLDRPGAGPPAAGGPYAGPDRGRDRGGVDRPTEPVPMVFTDSGEVAFPGGDDVLAGTGGTFPISGETSVYDTPRGPDGPAGPAGGWAGDPGGGGFGDDVYDDEYDDYDDYDDLDQDELPKRRGCRNALIVLAVLVVMAMIAGWFAWSWVQGKIDPPGPPGEEVLVEIPEGTGTAEIGEVLADAGVISDAGVWNWYTKVRDVGTIQAGSYRMRLNSSFSEAIDDLAAKPLPPDSRLVTVPEGLTQAQIAERLADPEKGVPGFTAEAVTAALGDPSLRSPIIPAEQTLLEGTLFPETYAVEEGVTELEVLQQMVDQFTGVATDLDLEGRAAALGYSPYDVLKVASLVEREAGTASDGPRVARVIYNRLAADEPLGIDASSCYEKGQIPCELTTAELEDNTPYDTRSQPGLPPTPIASPGRASIEAALAPAEGDWKWYVLDVTKDDGSSYFTNDYDDFLSAKARCEDAGRCG